MEITMIIGIIVFSLNFFTRKTKNQKMANQVTYLAQRRAQMREIQRRRKTGEKKKKPKMKKLKVN